MLHLQAILLLSPCPGHLNDININILLQSYQSSLTTSKWSPNHIFYVKLHKSHLSKIKFESYYINP